MIHRIIGPSGSGKSNWITEKIRADLANGISVFLIVPEQQAVNREREIITKLGNRSNLYVEVLNFRRFTNRAAREFGGLTYSYMDEGTRALLMNGVLTALNESLNEFAGAHENYRLTQRLLSSIDEMRACCVSPSELIRAAENPALSDSLRTKLADIALIYAAYSEAATGDYNDLRDSLKLLYTLLRENPSFFKGKKVYFDSFNGMTPEQMRIAELAALSADETYFSLCMRQDDQSDIFGKVKSYADKVLDIAIKHSIPHEDIVLEHQTRFTNEPLRYLERALWNNSAAPYDGKLSGEVCVLSCANIFAEAEAAANIALYLVREKGLMYRDIAISAGNLDRYDGILDLVFEKAEIPLFMSKRTDLTTHPVISLIISAFEIANSGWSTSSVMRYIKTGLSPLDDNECDELSLYALTWEIRGTAWHSDREWQMHPDGYRSYEADDETAQKIHRLNELRYRLIEPIKSFAGEVKKTTARGISAAIYGLLIALSASESLTTDLDFQMWRVLCGILDRMVDLMGDQQMSADKYLELFLIAVRAGDIGTIPNSVDQVTACNAGLLRVGDVKCTILLGVNDGIFPSCTIDESIFTAGERELLERTGAFKLSGDITKLMYDELFNFYFSAVSPSDCLYVLYSRAEISGTALNPSLMAKRVLHLFPQPDNIEYEKKTYARIQHKAFAFDILGQPIASDEDGAIKESLLAYFRADELYADILNRASRQFPDDMLVDPHISNLLFKNISLTASRLEDYSKCMFMYFCKHVLGLAPPASSKMQPNDIGNFIHDVLERFIKDVYEVQNTTLAQIDDRFIGELTSRLSDEYIRRIIPGFADKSERFKYLFARMKTVLYILIKNLREEFASSKFAPRGFEIAIGSDVPAVRLATQNGSLTVYGKVDRADTYESDGHTYLRVIDYKSGSKNFDLAEVLQGMNAQMLIYLFALCKSGADLLGENLTPAGILYVPTIPSGYDTTWTDETDDDVVNQHIKKRLNRNGLILEGEEMLDAMGKDIYGNFKQNKRTIEKRIASLEQMRALESKLNQVLINAAECMYSGRAAANPYRDAKRRACTYCEMRHICRIEPSSESFRDFPQSPSAQDIWDEIAKLV